MSVIVVGVDFSPCSGSALRQAIRIAASRRAAVHAVHIIEPLVVMDLEQALSPLQTDIRTGLIQDAGKTWKEFTAGIHGAGELELAVEIDHPVSAILRRVRERSADLLVLGTHGTSPAVRGAGTLATACVRKAMASVLLVKDDPQAGPFRSVVACIDFSPTSLKALEQAVSLALQDHAVLHVLHVFDAPWHRLHYRAPTPQASPDYQKQYRDGLRGRLEAFCAPHRGDMGEIESRYTVFEFTGHSAGITEFVRQVDGDLVVLGTRGRTGLRDMLLGSTAERVVRDVPCSILAVKPEGFEHPLGRGAAAQPRKERSMRKTIESKTVRDVMCRDPITVRPDTTIQELMTKFGTHDFNMFPVVDARGVLRGLVTKLDLLRTFRPQMRRFIPDLKLLWAERIEDVMSRGVISVEADDPITVAVDTMIDARLRSLPVVERRAGGPVLVGIVSRTDVLPYLTVQRVEAP